MAAVALTACVPPPPGPSPSGTAASVPAVPGDGALLAARQVLAEPAAAVAEAALDVGRRVDATRFEVPRGSAQGQAAADALARADELDAGADALDVASTRVDAELQPAAEAAAALADLGRDVAADARADLASLAPHTAHDVAVDAVIEGWGVRGSRQEIVERFDPLVAQADALVADARRLPTSPGSCTGLRANRIAWATRVAARTAELRDVAATFDGPRFDELEGRYRRAPRGEDPVAADAEIRPCWAAASPVATAPDRVAAAVRALEAALSR